MRAALCTALLLGACTDPSIQVVVELPEDLSGDIASMRLQVLVPPATEPFDCDGIAFDEVSDQTIHLSQVQEVALRDRDSADLAGIPRKGSKLFFASALNAEGEVLAFGCGEHGVVSGNALVVVEAEPRPVLEREEPPPDQPLPESLSLRLTDALGRSLPDVDIRWSVIGPGGETREGETLSGPDGGALVEPEPPALPGPVALDLRARWLRDRPPSLLAFETPPQVSFELPGIGADSDVRFSRSRYAVGRIGPEGEPGFAALGPREEGSAARQVLVAFYDPDQGGAAGLHTGSATLDPAPPSLGLVPAAGGGRDRVVAALAGVLLEIEPPDAAGEVRVTSTAAPIPFPALTTHSVGPCGPEAPPSEAALLIQSLTGDELAVIGPDGSPVASPFDALDPPGLVVSSGCVADAEGGRHRVVILQVGETGGSMIAADMDGLRTLELPASSVTYGFTEPVGEDPPYLLRHVTELTGIGIARELLAPQGAGGLELERVDKDLSALLPISSAGGDFDGDRLLDVSALFFFGFNEDRQAHRLGVNLGLEHRGARLSGVSGPAQADSPQHFVSDLDDDGLDDVLVGTPTEARVFLMAPGGR